MDYPSFFVPPVYQHAPSGAQDYLGPSHVPDGQPGADGASTLTGSGPPSDALGKDGDTYISLDAGGSALVFYGEKSGGHWPTTGTSMVGPPGLPGAGATGGDGPPDPNNVGPVGTLYLDRVNVDLYQAQA